MKENLVSIVTDEVITAASYLGLTSQVVQDLAQQVSDRLRLRVGGEDMRYISKSDPAARRTAVLAEFNGRNAAEVAKKYSITTRRVRQIVNGR